MKITVNNIEKEIHDGTTIEQFVVEENNTTAGIAIAVNDRVVRRAQWSETQLNDGDSVVLIKAAFGG